VGTGAVLLQFFNIAILNILAILHRHRHAPVSRYVSVCTDYSATAGSITAIQTNTWSVIDSTLAVANRLHLRQKRSKLGRTDRRQVSRQDFAGAMAIEQPALADYRRWRPPFPSA